MKETQYTYETTTDQPFDETVERCREALAEEGFGVLSEIDVQATLKKKLDVDREPYLILGACHPESAHRAIEAKPEVGVFLPCNVTVSRENGKTVVRAMNPGGVLPMLEHPVLDEVGQEVSARLAKVVEKVASATAVS